MLEFYDCNRRRFADLNTLSTIISLSECQHGIYFSSLTNVYCLHVYMLLHTILFSLMGLYRALYDCICWVYNLKQFGDLLIC